MRRFAQYCIRWAAPSSRGFDLLRIYALSTIIGLFYLYFGAFAVENGIAHYTQWSEAFVTGASLKGNSAFYIRDVGMAVVLFLSGYPFTHSFVGVVLLQFATAILIPILTYLSIRPWFPRTAYYTSIASVISLAPFLLAKTLHHDHPYIFLMILSLYIVNRYIVSHRPGYLYGLAVAVFSMSLIRQAGKGLHPLLMLVSLLEGTRKNLKHVFVSVLLFVALNFAYAKYRESVLGDLPVLGKQAFENVYFNLKDFGVKLLPEYGPNVKVIVDRLYECSLPSPAQAPRLQGTKAPGTPNFMAEHFYKYSAEQLVERMQTDSNFSYLLFLQGCVDNDHVFLQAALETAQARPLYVLGYIFRNAFQLLFDPGWLHAKSSMDGHIRGGLLFPFGGITTAGRPNIGDPLPEPALSEAQFIPLARQPDVVRDVYFAIEMTWYRIYHAVTIFMGVFIVIAWVSTLIGLAHKAFHLRWLARISESWLAPKVLPASLGISALLLGNVAVTAIFLDSYYRYDFSLLSFKIMLAGIGITITINLLKQPAVSCGRALWSYGNAVGTLTRSGIVRVRGAAFPQIKDRIAFLVIGLLLTAYLAGTIYTTLFDHDTKVRSNVTVQPGAPSVAASNPIPAVAREVLKATALHELPRRPPPSQWDLIWGLNATIIPEPEVLNGQPVLRLTAVPSDERHAVAARFHDLEAGRVYRVSLRIKAASGVNGQLAVRDAVNPSSGTPDNEGEVRYNLASLSVISSNGRVLAQGINRDDGQWRNLWAEIRINNSEMFVYFGLLEADSNIHVFAAQDQNITLGGIEIVAVQ